MEWYNPRLPLGYFSIGDKYFFVKGVNHNNHRISTPDEIERYADIINDEDKSLSGQIGSLRYNLVPGVIINKNEGSQNNVEVMLVDGTVWEYATDYKGSLLELEEHHINSSLIDLGELPPAELRYNSSNTKAVSYGVTVDREKVIDKKATGVTKDRAPKSKTNGVTKDTES